MFEDIVKRFRDLAEKLNHIQTFRYGLITKTLGVNEDDYGLFYLENPILVETSKLEVGTMVVQLNFQILFTPNRGETKNLNIVECQSLAEKLAQAFILKMKSEYKQRIAPFNPLTFSIIPTMKWYDDDSAGVRVSMRMECPNPLNYCLVDDYFNEEKEWNTDSAFNDIDYSNAEDCKGNAYTTTRFPKINYK